MGNRNKTSNFDIFTTGSLKTYSSGSSNNFLIMPKKLERFKDISMDESLTHQ